MRRTGAQINWNSGHFLTLATDHALCNPILEQSMQPTDIKQDIADIHADLDGRTIAMVGLMGAGKSVIGRKVAARLKLPFIDADNEIVEAAKMPITEIFETYGEPEFRRLEERVINRLLEDGPQILATGGGAFMNDTIRESIAEKGISLWLSADIDLLMERVSKRSSRPLLKNDNPRGVMMDLMEKRYPVYAQASIEVPSQDGTKDDMAAITIHALANYFRAETSTKKQQNTGQ